MTTMLIVDSNIVFGDLLLQGEPTSKVLSAAKTLGGVVAIPAIVRHEMIGLFREQMGRELSAVSKIAKTLKRVGAPTEHTTALSKDITEAIAHYEERIDGRLTALGWLSLAYPEVPHEELALRAIEKRAPFSPNGRGYRDTLVWYCARAAAKTRPVVLITGDAIFHGNTKGAAAPALREDLTNEGVPAGNLLFVGGLPDLYLELVEPMEAAFAKLRTDFALAGPHTATVAHAIHERIEGKLPRTRIPVQRSDGFASDGKATVSRVHRTSIGALEIDEVWREEEDTCFSGAVEVEVVFSAESEDDDGRSREAAMYDYVEVLWSGRVEGYDLDTLAIDDLHFGELRAARLGRWPSP